MGVPCRFFLFQLLRQNSLHHIPGLGDVREIDFGCDALWGARRRSAPLAAGPGAALEMRAYLLSLKAFQRTGMGLACAQAELRQNVKNLPALDFHLAREIVDTNLTHPPLFRFCYPKPLVAHSYLMALAALHHFIIA
jgi:hypothetical protein